MQNWKTAIGFIAGIGSLTTLMIPMLSIFQAVVALIFFFLMPKDSPKGIRWSVLGMAVLALILDLVYLLVVGWGGVTAIGW
jgi:uncharacterized membrane protein (DUF106 family)